MPAPAGPAQLARIAVANPVLALFVHVAAQSARAEADQAARELAAGQRRGPLHGIPFAVKDTIEVKGMPRRAGSRLLDEPGAAADAGVVARLRAAGAICIGKLATWEYGTGDGVEYFDLIHPPALNPWDPSRFTGGSSTGSGASVAAGLIPFALGSDTTGSVRTDLAALRAQAHALGLGALSVSDLVRWDQARRDAPGQGASLPRPATKEVVPAFGLQLPFA